jgi:rod shape-determining protein MreC
LKQFFTPKVKAILIAAIVMALLSGVIISATTEATAAERLVGAVLAPVRSVASAITRQAEQVYDYLFRFDALKAENEQLKQQILEMEEDVRTAQAYQRENERLQQLLDLKTQHEDYQFAAAYITSWNASNWKDSFTIDQGEKSGIAEGMCAVTEYGQVVGIVAETGANWATVVTIHDSTMEISASITSSGYTGVVQGSFSDEDTLRMNYLAQDAVIKNNDQIVTTGSNLYPKGLILGYVTDVQMAETGVEKYAVVRPSADFEELEQIFIITDYDNS